MQLAVCAGLWGRQVLAPLWWQALDRLRETWRAAGHTVELVVGGSEPEHRARAEAHGAVWVETPNRPLGRKLNDTVQAAFDRGAEYLLILNADGFASPAIDQAYLDAIVHGRRYVGLQAIYYWELSTGRACLFGYPRGHFRYGEPLGHGRLLHRSLLLDGRPWDDDRNKGLDRSMTRRLRLPRAHLLAMTEEQVAINVVMDENIWSFDQMAGAGGSRIIGVDPPVLGAVPEWGRLRATRESAA